MIDIVKLFIVYTLFLYANSASAESIDIYDAMGHPGYIVIEAIDDCNFSHKLLIPLNLADSHKPGDWIELLMVSGEWNKCLTNGM